ncbi:MAG: FKBP-type peptidyl-prolyl cis-trans isomerase [Candidatus Nanoarchaeia archaeon]|nr:FKBP-type peptidyl-prolyl cis-trans isomerase [Candidatus Nanoarchaeia archaeon]MDD4563738.1 FKBP-type peptidyl-prolyl cis-trans isomerase [Candidatus Nanoarchaeia archaeon]
MTIKEKDFVEIEFTGKIKDSQEIFDSNIQEDIKKAKLDIKEIKPFILSVGQKMLPSGFDQDLIEKEINKEYTLELKPEDAFGKRDKELIKMVPTRLFLEQRINPQRGMQLNLDGQIVKILSNSGGRTLIDFNHPLAGKEVVYNYKINRIVKNENEKIDALFDFFFKQKLEYEVKDKKIIFKELKKELKPYLQIFAPKIKEILDLEINLE